MGGLYRQRRWFAVLLAVPMAWPLCVVQRAHGHEPRSAPSDKAALGALFAAKQNHVDVDVTRMQALARELAARPLASAAQSELAQLEALLLELAAAAAQNSDAATLSRGKALAWAELSLIDRLIARAQAKAALGAAEARAALAEARAHGAQAVLERAQRDLALAKGTGQ